MIQIPESVKKNKKYIALAAAILAALVLAIDGDLLKAIQAIDEALKLLE